MAETQNTQTINTIIVLRNDHGQEVKFGTQSSNVILQPGELGIHYLDNGNAVVKMGDGLNKWADLKQVEGVFEQDQIITQSFGRFTTSNSKPVNAGGAGMTTSEWLMHCLSEVIPATITQPSYSALSASTITTNSNTKEVGSKVTKIAWDGTFSGGSYNYGYRTDSNNDGKIDDNDTWNKTDTTTGITPVYTLTSTKAGTFSGQTVDGTLTLTTPIQITDAASVDLGSITCKCTWAASTRYPVNNIGQLSGSPIAANTTGTERTANFSVTGFRKMFMGISDTDATVENTKLTSDFIRGLTTVSEKAAKTTKEFKVSAGKKYFYVAIPESLTTNTPTFKYKPFSNWESFGTVNSLGTVSVEGYDGYEAKPYRIYRGYSETGSFEADTNIQVTIS